MLLRLVVYTIRVDPGCLNLYDTSDWQAVPDADSSGHDIETAYHTTHAMLHCSRVLNELVNQPRLGRLPLPEARR